jgi:anti-sigma regulatory factor (Ser/Thr protein kinase)
MRVPADLAVVSFVRSALAAVLVREEWPAEGASRVLLASSEALTNAIEHGSLGGAAVEVELSVTSERVDVRVLDEGRPGGLLPVVPSEPPPPTSIRGRGLIIISRLSDDFALSARGRGTQADVGFLRCSAEGALEAQAAGGVAAWAA